MALFLRIQCSFLWIIYNINLDIKVTVIAANEDDVFGSAVGIWWRGWHRSRIYWCAGVQRTSINKDTLRHTETESLKYSCIHFTLFMIWPVNHYHESILWQRRAKESREIFKQHGGHVTIMLHGSKKSQWHTEQNCKCTLALWQNSHSSYLSDT